VCVDDFECRREPAPEGSGAGVELINDLPRMVRRMLMKKSAPQPRSRKTPTGGRMMARRILQMSLKGMLVHVVMLLFPVPVFSTAREDHPAISCDSVDCGSLGMTSSFNREYCKKSAYLAVKGILSVVKTRNYSKMCDVVVVGKLFREFC
jgi:hypothetical protein